MKRIKLLSLSLLALLGSCAESDNAIDELFENTERGAVLRTISVNNPDFSISDPSSVFSVTLEEQDAKEGDLLQSVDVYVSFSDETPGRPDDTDYSKEEVLLTTIPADVWEDGPIGLPRYTFETTFGDVLTALNIGDNDFAGADIFNIRFALNLTDGRTFTSTDGNGNIFSGSFFRSPFLYRAPIVCPPAAPTPGTWSMEFQDSYGDGWNGASLEVVIDGTTTSYTMDDGAAASFTFDVPDGAQEINFIFRSGDWDSEITFQVTSASGFQVMSIGPSPTPDTPLAIDYCNI